MCFVFPEADLPFQKMQSAIGQWNFFESKAAAVAEEDTVYLGVLFRNSVIFFSANQLKAPTVSI
jgi:hypothetical protein